ncbi:nitronate monooxygenase [Amycolatopsis rhabdoformis]|uniref:Nitronate monooxygenase n=1 Tax=Amycolatopsis rhabdoformis TaxID=1448059 RepID=A0ABZ1IA20_9PSEU|nr:nitronate monooxygenase [Amycolatopsis rhabdoformis]WSE30906.1 nitronate monooxygenase [Amycolatopsis rhabdoformis]
MKTALTDLVGVRHPVVQTGMGWVAGPRLVSATAEAGGLGILASATMTYDELAAALKETRARTENPFGVNLRADAEDAARRVDLLITEGVRVASFALAPRRELITKLKDHGVVVLPSVGAARHAEKVAEWGADAVVVQGGEGGGHTGGVATTLLLPAVLDAVDIPVVAAGGFFDGRGLAAALAYGAAGIAMGTRFLLTRESTVPDGVKQRYLDHDLTGTLVTRKVDGLPHRVLRTGLVDALEKSGPLSGFVRAAGNAARFRRLSGLSWTALAREGLRSRRGGRTRAQVLMAANTPMLLRAGLVDGDPAAGVLASGQVVGLLHDLPSVAGLIEEIVADAEAILRRLGDGGCA